MEPSRIQRVHEDPRPILRVMAEFVVAFDTLPRLPAAVSFLGSARSRPEDPRHALAEAIAAGSAKECFAVITGGWPGIMEAADKAAAQTGGISVGLPSCCPGSRGRTPIPTQPSTSTPSSARRSRG